MIKFFRRLWWSLWEHRYFIRVVADLLIVVDNTMDFEGYVFDFSRLKTENMVVLIGCYPKDTIDAAMATPRLLKRQEFYIHTKKGKVVWIDDES